MKKILLALVILFTKTTFAQVVSITPNTGSFGQVLNTTITLASGVINVGSPPMQQGDIYLQKGNNYIYADNFSLSAPPPGPYDDTINAQFTMPMVGQPGYYDVHVLQQTWIPIPPYVQVTDNVLPNGFLLDSNVTTISGHVYYDANQNGSMDTGEFDLSNVYIDINGLYGTLTDANGNYEVGGAPGTYTVTPIIGSGWTTGWTITSTPVTYSVSIPPDTPNCNFGIYYPLPNPLTQRFTTITGRMRCNTQGMSSWYVQNNLNVSETGSITVIHSPNLQFDSSSIVPTSSSSNTLTWDYSIGGLSNLMCQMTFTSPAAGDTIWISFIDSVFNMNGVFQQVYTSYYYRIVSCAYDPNDKSVQPIGIGPQHLTLQNTEFDYVVQFQNTGNDTAYDVVIVDTIDSNLDLNSIQLLASSDPVTLEIQPNGYVRFIFDNIMLPDSNVDEPGSHGFVSYRISANSGLPDSTDIENTAYIYFDFNAPIMTNTTSNKIVSQIITAVDKVNSENSPLVYPNPVSGISKLPVPDGEFDLTIYDMNGRIVLQQKVSNEFMINNSKFSEGVYHYRLTNRERSLSGRFIVM